jgi:hypothetical protein
MTAKISDPVFQEKRADLRSLVKGNDSVEFKVKGTGPIYRFRLWDESAHGMSILVKQDSAVFTVLHVHDLLEMDYYADSAISSKTIQTKIAHITKQDSGRFKGHCIVGLSILSSEPAT